MATPNSAPNSAKRRRTDEPPELETRTYTIQRILGKGSFGVVYQSHVSETNETVAIKSMHLQEKDREVQVLKELEGHPNIVCLKGAFLSGGEGKEQKLNLVLEFLSDTLHRVIKHHNQLQKKLSQQHVKLYAYQLMRALAFIHCKGIVHCDVKPQNLLLDGNSQTLKLCDFGTARRLVFGEKSMSYVCSRYFRAPELILGSTTYSTPVDLWSAGCVFGEMILGQPLFTGRDGIDQLVEIIKVVGTPTPAELKAMNPNYPDYQFTPSIPGFAWDKVFRGWTSREANEFAGLLLRYDPHARMPALTSLMHRYFDALRMDRKTPRSFFEFLPEELHWCNSQNVSRLIPTWMQQPVTNGHPRGQ